MLIIGDYTARVGDPSGRDTQRPILTPEEIDANAKTFQDQAFKVLDREATEVRFNSEWLDMPAAGAVPADGEGDRGAAARTGGLHQAHAGRPADLLA